MNARALRTVAFASLLACLRAPSALGAPTDDDIAKAKKRFEEGKSLEDANKWSDALAAFQDVAAVKMTAQVRFQIAFCDENLGHWVAALRGYDEALSLAEQDEERAKDVVQAAPERRDALKPRVPRIVFDLEGPGIEGGRRFAVLVDGAPVEADAIHLPVGFDVGAHTIDLETVSDGEKGTQHIADVTLVERQERRIRIDVPMLGRGAPRPPVVARPAASTGTKIPAIVVGSVGIASLIGAGVFLALRQDAISQVRDGCKDPDNDTGCDPKLIPIADDGRTYTYVSASLAAVGVAALGTAAVLWVTVGANHSNSASTSVVLSPGFVGVRGRF